MPNYNEMSAAFDHDGHPAYAPWDVLCAWVEDGEYQATRPSIRRIPIGPGGLTEDYDIEFTWPNAFRYDHADHNVMAHLHVRAGQPQKGGGIWVPGLTSTGMNWNTIHNYRPLEDFMKYYVE